MSTIKMKPIRATPTVTGQFAEEIIKEAMRKPSENSIKRNEAASALLKKLRSN